MSEISNNKKSTEEAQQLISYNQRPNFAKFTRNMITFSRPDHLKRYQKLNTGLASNLQVFNMLNRHERGRFTILRNFRYLTDLRLDLSNSDDKELKSLSTSIALLSHLAVFALFMVGSEKVSDNGIKAITQAIFQLKRLNYCTLEIFCQNITKHSIKNIFHCLRFPKNLLYLMLRLDYDKTLNESDLDILWSSLKGKISLTTLVLNLYKHSMMTAKSFEKLSQVLTSLTNLTKLHLSLDGKRISDDDIRSISLSLECLPCLSNFSLEISNSKRITKEIIKSLSAGMRYLVNLSSFCLSIHYCKRFGNLETEHLASELLKSTKNLLSLKLTFIGCRKFRKTDIQSLISSLHHQVSLHTLKLDLHKMDDKLLLDLSASFQELPLISTLEIGLSNFSKITNKGIRDLSSGLRHLHSLSSFSLDLSLCNMVNNQGLDSLFECLKELKLLSELNLALVNWEGLQKNSIKSLFSGLQSLSRLKKLMLNMSVNIFVNDEQIEILTMGIAYLTSLEELSLSLCYCNSITDKKIKNLAFDLEKLPLLAAFHLKLSGCNHITRNAIEDLASNLEKLPHLSSFSIEQ